MIHYDGRQTSIPITNHQVMNIISINEKLIGINVKRTTTSCWMPAYFVVSVHLLLLSYRPPCTTQHFR